jgi:hypothetical protein
MDLCSSPPCIYESVWTCWPSDIGGTDRAFQKELYNGIPNVTLWRVLLRAYLEAHELSLVQAVERGNRRLWVKVTFPRRSF